MRVNDCFLEIEKEDILTMDFYKKLVRLDDNSYIFSGLQEFNQVLYQFKDIGIISMIVNKYLIDNKLTFDYIANSPVDNFELAIEVDSSGYSYSYGLPFINTYNTLNKQYVASVNGWYEPTSNKFNGKIEYKNEK